MVSGNLDSHKSYGIEIHIIEPRLSFNLSTAGKCKEYYEDLQIRWRVMMNIFGTPEPRRDAVTLVTHGDSARMATIITLLSYWKGGL